MARATEKADAERIGMSQASTDLVGLTAAALRPPDTPDTPISKDYREWLTTPDRFAAQA